MNWRTIHDHYWISETENGSAWELGRGTLGVTYRAEDTNTKTPVALKVIDATQFTKGQQDRFAQDVRTAWLLRNRNIAQVHPLVTEDADFYYATEFVPGKTLETVVQEGGVISPRLALMIGSRICEALETAEARGLVHGDIRPANVMLGNDDGDETGPEVKVLDFGLRTAALASNLPKTPRALQFASPEKAGGRAVDGRSDLYSLGCTIWFCLTGESPLATGVTRGSLIGPDWSNIRRLPKTVKKLLMRMLQRDPAERPQNATEARREILYCWASLDRKEARVRQAVVLNNGAARLGMQPAAPKRKMALTSALVLLALLGITWGAAELSRSESSATTGPESTPAKAGSTGKEFAQTAAMDKEFLNQDQTPAGKVPLTSGSVVEEAEPAAPSAIAPVVKAGEARGDGVAVAHSKMTSADSGIYRDAATPTALSSQPNAVAEETTPPASPTSAAGVEEPPILSRARMGETEPAVTRAGDSEISRDAATAGTEIRQESHASRMQMVKRPSIALAGSVDRALDAQRAVEKPATAAASSTYTTQVRRAIPVGGNQAVAQGSRVTVSRHRVPRGAREEDVVAADDGEATGQLQSFYGPSTGEDEPAPVAEGPDLTRHHTSSRTSEASPDHPRWVVRRTTTYPVYAPADEDPGVVYAPATRVYGYSSDERDWVHDRDHREREERRADSDDGDSSREDGFFHRLFHHHDEDDDR